VKVGAVPARAHEAVWRVASCDAFGQQQVADLVRDGAREQAVDRHAKLRRLRFDASHEHIRGAGAVRRSRGGAHHGVRALLKRAAFAVQQDDENRPFAAARFAVRPHDVHADLAIQPCDFDLRRRQRRRVDTRDVGHLQDDGERDRVNHGSAIDCARLPCGWRLREK
jgi:hypothetical protein